MSLALVGVSPDDGGFGAVAALFDGYRVHYGQRADPVAAAAWLAEQIIGGGLRLTAAFQGDRPVGLITTLVLPASLRLGVAWSVRDLYVNPAARRGGVARTLLKHVIAEASAAGALRVSLQTEPGNTAAQALYAALGFTPVQDLDILNLRLHPNR